MAIVHGQRARNGYPLLLAAGELAGMFGGLFPRPTRFKSACDLSVASSGERLRTLICARLMLAVTVMCGNNSKFWNTMPMRDLNLGRLVPERGDS